MASDSDDDYERVSNFDLSDSEDEQGYNSSPATSATTPHTSRSLRPSDLKKLPCPYDNCSKTFNRQARLIEHIRSHTNTRIFKCPHLPCTKDFLRHNHLKRHIKSAHSDVRDYNCSWDGCDKSFSTGTRLRRHEAAHEGKEKYRCRGYEGCNETFRKHDTLRRHISSVHELMRPFPCPDTDLKTGQPCTQAYETAEKLRQHQRTRHDSTRFSCTICLEELSNDLEDNEEISIESNIGVPEKPISAYFATYADLRLHLTMVHPPTCHLCPTSFITTKELTRHLELQHGVIDPDAPLSQREFPCTYPECSRTFTKKGNLNVHVKTVHENRKDFVCGQMDITISDVPEAVELVDSMKGCGRAFTTKASLEEHIRTAHLGLNRKKRRGEDEGETVLKKRKSRKDKGVKKVSALSRLLASGAARTVEPAESQDDAENNAESPDLLTGSVTMYGSQLYRPNYSPKDHADGFALRQGNELGDDCCIFSPQFSSSYPGENEDGEDVGRDEDDFVFDGFDRDFIPIDPILMLTHT